MSKENAIIRAVVESRVAGTDRALARYMCLTCGYTYDPKRGDAKGGIEPGTSGDDLPHDWCCPTCGKDQTYFARRDD